MNEARWVGSCCGRWVYPFLSYSFFSCCAVAHEESMKAMRPTSAFGRLSRWIARGMGQPASRLTLETRYAVLSIAEVANANLFGAATPGGSHSGNPDSHNSPTVELHCCPLLDRHWNTRAGENVKYKWMIANNSRKVNDTLRILFYSTANVFFVVFVFHRAKCQRPPSSRSRSSIVCKPADDEDRGLPPPKGALARFQN